MTSAPASDYRLPAVLVARIVGSALVVLAVALLATTMVVAGAGWSPDVLVLAVLVGALALGGLAWWLRARAYVVRFDAEGYRVGVVRGAGVRAAPWSSVTHAETATVAGVPLVVLALSDGSRTTLPVSLLEGDREELVRDLQRRLQAGHGVRPLSDPEAPEVDRVDPSDS